MSERGTGSILESLAGFLVPVSRFLLRAGVTYKDFEEIAKRAFVQSAIQSYGVRGRPTNVSRVALLTGLTRKEVKQIKEGQDTVLGAYERERSLSAEVLHRWHTAAEYVDADTRMPIVLPFAGDGLSFSSLVRACMRDIPPGAVRAELKRQGAIVELDSGELKVVKREAIPLDAFEKLVEGIETGLGPMAETIAHNSDPQNEKSVRFQRVVVIPFCKTRRCTEGRGGTEGETYGYCRRVR